MVILRNLISKAEQWENPKDDENYSTELLNIHTDLDNLGIYHEFEKSDDCEHIRIPFITDPRNDEDLYLLTSKYYYINKDTFLVAILSGLLVKAPEELRESIDGYCIFGGEAFFTEEMLEEDPDFDDDDYAELLRASNADYN